MKKILFALILVFLGTGMSFGKNWKLEDGIYLLNNKNYDEAQSFFEGYTRVYPNNPDGYYYLGLTYKEKNDLNNSVLYLKKSFDLTNDVIDINVAPQMNVIPYEDYIDLAQMYLEVGQIETALNYLDMLEKISPNNTKALYMKSEIYLNRGNEDFARQAFLKALDEDNSLINSDVARALNLTKIPDFSGEFFNAKGLQYFYAGDLERAKEYFKKAIKRELNHAEAYNNLGIVDYKLHNLKEAEINFRKAVLFNKHLNFAYLNLAKIKKEQKNKKSELKYIEKAIKSNPNDALNYWSMGKYLFDEEKYDEAIDYFKKTLSINNEYYEAALQLGISYLKINQDDEALKIFRKIMAKSNNPEIYYYLADLCLKENRIGEAEEYLKQALKKGENPYYYSALGEIELKLGEFSEAKESFSAAKDLFEKTGNKEEANKALLGIRKIGK